MKWYFLAAAIAFEVTGSLSLKAALDAPGFFALAALGYIGAFVFLAGALRRGMPLGVGYGIWGAAGVAMTAIMSAIIFSEPLTALMTIGIAVIIGGVLCIELGSQAASKKREGIA